MPEPMTEDGLADLERWADRCERYGTLSTARVVLSLIAEVRRLRAERKESPRLIAETHTPRSESHRRAAWGRLREMFPGLCEGVTP